MSTTTRHIGYCPACDSNFKVRSGKLVHHGYKRPGHGYIEGDCIGALEQPHELSPKLAEKCLASAEAYKAGQEKRLADLPEVTTLSYMDYQGYKAGHVLVTIIKGSDDCSDYAFEQERKRQIRKTEQNIAMIEGEIARLSALVANWEAKPLTTVEEEKAAKREAKEAREAKKAQAKAEKIEAQVKKYQKRIDSALKTKNSGTLADIWESIQRKLTDMDSSLSRADALKAVERDHVWEAFGLGGLTLSPWRAQEKPEKAPLRRMKDRQDRLKGHHENVYGTGEWAVKCLEAMNVEWPAELDGENRKGAKTLNAVRTRLSQLKS